MADDTDDEDPPSTMNDLLGLAVAIVDEDPLSAAAKALALAQTLHGDLGLLFDLDEQLHELRPEAALFQRLADLAQQISQLGEHELALSVAESLLFISPDDFGGDIALILARAGRREAALARVERNLAAASEPSVAEAKAGDVYRELGEPDSAEVYYRRSLTEAKNPADRRVATLRIASLLSDTGREADASRFLEEQRRAQAFVPAVGRNEPCPCGSGKKYKKCHGAAGP